MENFREWLTRLSVDTVITGVLTGDREVVDLVDLVWAWIQSSLSKSAEDIELEVRTAIEESLQALQEDGVLLYHPDVDAIVERALYWVPGQSNQTSGGAS